MLTPSTLGILLVQRDRQCSRAVSRSLRAQGFDVIAAPSVAMAEVLECAFDVGVIELALEDGDGLELARGLLAAGRIEEVVFYTAGVGSERLEAARQLGAVVVHQEGIAALLPVLVGLARVQGARQSGKVPLLDTVPDELWQSRAG